jgi:hypothetical protein
VIKKTSTLYIVAFRVATGLSVVKTLWIVGLISGRDIKLSGLIFAVNYRGHEMVLKDISRIPTIFWRKKFKTVKIEEREQEH